MLLYMAAWFTMLLAHGILYRYMFKQDKNLWGEEKRIDRNIKLWRFIERYIRYKDGRHWGKLRAKCYRRLLSSTGEKIKICCGTIIKEPQNIQMGDRISIQENSYLSGYGGLSIGSDVSMGTGTYIFTSTHPLTGGIIRNNPLEKMPVVVGSNVWLGAGVRIMGGVTIGSNVVVGAGSVVTHDLPDNGVYAGVPAKKIRELSS